jgi:hypothetical protein
MDTKLKGDVAEQAATLYALKRGWGVLKPIGDRLPYDLVFDVNSILSRFRLNQRGFTTKSRTMLLIIDVSRQIVGK